MNTKIIIKKYYKIINSQSWEDLDQLLHDEFHFEHSKDLVEQFNYQAARDYEAIITIDPQNIYQTFESKIVEKHPNILNYTPKEGLMAFYEVLSIYEAYRQQCDIIYMIAEEERCWVFFTQTDFYENEKISYIGNQYFWLKENKIVSIMTIYDWLTMLIQQGKLTLAQNNQEMMDSYLDRLKELHIIPQTE